MIALCQSDPSRLIRLSMLLGLLWSFGAGGCGPGEAGFFRDAQASDARVSISCKSRLNQDKLVLGLVVKNVSNEILYVGTPDRPSVVLVDIKGCPEGGPAFDGTDKVKEVHLLFGYQALGAGCFDLGTGASRKWYYELRSLQPGESMSLNATVDLPLKQTIAFADGCISGPTANVATAVWTVQVGYFREDGMRDVHHLNGMSSQRVEGKPALLRESVVPGADYADMKNVEVTIRDRSNRPLPPVASLGEPPPATRPGAGPAEEAPIGDK